MSKDERGIRNYDLNGDIIKMLRGVCPKCNREEVYLHKTISRDGFLYKLRCEKCGVMYDVLKFEDIIEPDDTVMKVLINGKSTNLIVDRMDFNDKMLSLSAVRKPRTLDDMLNDLKKGKRKQHHINEIKKLINPEFNTVINLDYTPKHLMIIVDEGHYNIFEIAKDLEIPQSEIEPVMKFNGAMIVTVEL